MPRALSGVLTGPKPLDFVDSLSNYYIGWFTLYSCNNAHFLRSSFVICSIIPNNISLTLTLINTVSCPTLTPTSHLHMDTTSTTENTVVRFTCDSGYRLVGSDHTECESSGHWSNGLPNCQRSKPFSVKPRKLAF